MLPASVQSTVANSIVSRLSQQNPEVAAQLLMSLNPMIQKGEIRAVSAEWAGRDLSAAVQWVKQLQDGELKYRALDGLLRFWTRNDLEGAADYVLLTLPAGPKRDLNLREITTSWAESNLEPALTWANRQPDGPLKETALIAVYQGWIRTSPTEGSAYIANLPLGQDRDLAIAAAVQEWGSSGPAAAAVWLESLGNSEQIQIEIANLASQWMLQDRNAAFAWIQKLLSSSTITDPVKERLLKIPMSSKMKQQLRPIHGG
jgi:hypothetical protein